MVLVFLGSHRPLAIEGLWTIFLKMQQLRCVNAISGTDVRAPGSTDSERAVGNWMEHRPHRQPPLKSSQVTQLFDQ